MNYIFKLLLSLFLIGLFTSYIMGQGKVDSLNQALKSSSVEQRPAIYHALFIHYRLTDREKALNYALKANAAAYDAGDSLLIVNSSRALGWLYLLKDQYDTAVDYYEIALEVAKESNNMEMLKELVNELGIANFWKGDYDEALSYYLDCLRLEETENDEEGMATVCNNIGLVYSEVKDYEKARDYYEKSLVLNEKIGRQSGLNRNYVNMGLVYIDLGDYDEALVYFNKALDLCGDDCDDEILMWSNNGIGQALLISEDYDSAKNKFERSNALAIENNFDKYVTDNYHYLAKIKFKINELDSAIYLLDRSHEIAEKIGNRDYLLNNNELYSQIYSQLGDYRKAYNYQIKFRALNDSIYTKDLAKNLANIQLNYQEEQNRIMLEARDETIKANNRTIRATRSLNYVLIGASGIVIAFLIALYRNYREKQKTYSKLEEANSIIEAQKRKLEDTNAVLEDRVKDRTKELRQSYKALQQSNDELDTFIYRTSHDIRGPLASLLGLSEVALFDVTDERSLDYFGKLNQTANNLNEILSRVLDITQVKSTSNFGQEIDFENIIDDILDKRAQLDFFEEIGFTSHIDKGLRYRSDPYLILTIINNLVDNAYKFYNSSTRVESFVKVEISTYKSSVNIKVLDNGIGISKEDTVKIFEIFSKASNRPDTAGLGLYLVKLAVERLKGKVSVETTASGYTEFKVHLPEEPKEETPQ